MAGTEDCCVANCSNRKAGTAKSEGSNSSGDSGGDQLKLLQCSCAGTDVMVKKMASWCRAVVVEVKIEEVV